MKSFLVRTLTVIPVALALLIPISNLRAAADDHDDHDQRYYDRQHKDYHHWDADEDRAYHRYWEQRHHEYIDWDHANARQRQAYWKWRHEHADHDHDGDRH